MSWLSGPFDFCRIHIFSATGGFLLCSQAEKTRDIMSSMFVFTRERVNPTDLSYFTDSLQTYIGERSYSSSTDNLLAFCTTSKLSSIYRQELIVIYCALMNGIKRRSQFRRNSNLQLSFLLFYFSVVIQSGEFLASVHVARTRGGKLLSPKTLLYSNISNYSVFTVLGKSCYSFQYM